MQGLVFHSFYNELTLRYAQLPLKPLKITASVINGMITGVSQEIYLDGLLAWAVTAIYGSPDEICTIPLPLECSWFSSQGLPLWTCTPFELTDAIQSFRYWHKRFPQYQMMKLCEKPNASTSSGRHKEYRVPVSISYPKSQVVTAYCIGNEEEIAKLLESVAGIGKKPSMGYGAIARWQIESSTITKEEILQRRPIPIEYFSGKLPEEMTVQLRAGWTPPYWNKTQHTKVVLNRVVSLF